MNQTTININGKEIVAETLPIDAIDIRIRFGKYLTYQRTHSFVVETFDGDYKPFLSNQLTEEQWKEIVEPILHVFDNTVWAYEDYMNKGFGSKRNATESGYSLLASKGLNKDNTVLLIKMK